MEIIPFYCVRLKGRALTDELRRVLLRTAWKMIADQQERQDVGGGWESSYEGCVATRRRYASIGGLAGMVFYATICSNDSGDVEVDYLAPPADFQELFDGPADDASPNSTPEDDPLLPIRPELN